MTFSVFILTVSILTFIYTSLNLISLYLFNKYLYLKNNRFYNLFFFKRHNIFFKYNKKLFLISSIISVFIYFFYKIIAVKNNFVSEGEGYSCFEIYPNIPIGQYILFLLILLMIFTKYQLIFNVFFILFEGKEKIRKIQKQIFVFNFIKLIFIFLFAFLLISFFKDFYIFNPNCSNDVLGYIYKDLLL